MLVIYALCHCGRVINLSRFKIRKLQTPTNKAFHSHWSHLCSNNSSLQLKRGQVSEGRLRFVFDDESTQPCPLTDWGSVSTQITRGRCSGSEKSFFGNFITFTFQTDGPLFCTITFSELIWCQLNSNESRRNTSVWNCLHTLSWAELAVIFQRTGFFETVGGEPKDTNIFWEWE